MLLFIYIYIYIEAKHRNETHNESVIRTDTLNAGMIFLRRLLVSVARCRDVLKLLFYFSSLSPGEVKTQREGAQRVFDLMPAVNHAPPPSFTS